MEKVNILVIGAGVVGLATAKVLSEHFDDVVIVEKEKSFGRHTSSRNSEVLHSGIYYPQPLHLTQPCKALGYTEGDFPDSEKASRETLAIPIYPEMTEEQIHFVLATLEKIA